VLPLVQKCKPAYGLCKCEIQGVRTWTVLRLSLLVVLRNLAQPEQCPFFISKYQQLTIPFQAARRFAVDPESSQASSIAFRPKVMRRSA
jgi:hypothetical protein